MYKRPVFIIIAVQSVIIALLFIYIALNIGAASKIEVLEDQMNEIGELQKTCLERNDSLSALLQQIRITNVVPPLLDTKQIEDLKKKGLNDPVQDLRNDLISGPDIIGASPVLGGKMGFYFHDGIHVLNKKWVLAYFEDGHMAGALLLRYEVEQDGNIAWEVIDEIIY